RERQIPPYLARPDSPVREQSLERTAATRRFVDGRNALRRAVRDRVSRVWLLGRCLGEEPHYRPAARIRYLGIQYLTGRIERDDRELAVVERHLTARPAEVVDRRRDDTRPGSTTHRG